MRIWYEPKHWFYGYEPLFDRLDSGDEFPLPAHWNQCSRQLNCTVRFEAHETLSDDMAYELRVLAHQVIPMRLNSHDFYNNLTWLSWPKLKTALFQTYAQEGLANARTKAQNTLALFEENGLILAAKQPCLFEPIQNFDWVAAFLEGHDAFGHSLQPIVYGHGLLDKAKDPYLGITAHAIFCVVPEAFFDWEPFRQIAWLDDRLAKQMMANQFPQTPRALQPVPVMGLPGWSQQQDRAFYENTTVFRHSKPREIQPINLVSDQ